jgi:MFS family permease
MLACMDAKTTPRQLIWAATVGLVLADSSIVTLALPDVLREFDATVFGVSWVLTAYNIVLAAAILPVVRFARPSPARTWGIGLIVFGLASLACALSPSAGFLIGARCVQALGGAAVLAGAIELLARDRGSHRAAVGLWGVAGTIGLALGPAVGGVLTELFSWQSIFLLQAPLLLLVPFAAKAPVVGPERGPEGPNEAAPEFALGLLSAGLTAALFLLVILLTEGWGLSPIAAAAVVTIIPVATVIAGRIEPAPLGSWIWAMAGTIGVAGGLLALGVLPGASPNLTFAPQILIGAGLAMTLPVLTAAAVEVNDPDGSRAASTIAARHAGIVVGILLLTPLLSAQLSDQHDAGTAAGTALLLDAGLSPETKVTVAAEIDGAVDEADGQLPDLDAAFASVRAEAPPEEAGALDELEAGVTDQLERAATHAFSLPFIGAALLAALALIPIGLLIRSHGHEGPDRHKRKEPPTAVKPPPPYPRPEPGHGREGGS